MTTPTTEAPNRERYMASVPAKYRGIAERAFAGQGSKGNAIKAKCLDCTSYVRADIEHCRVVLCPLYEFRPRSEGRASQEQQGDSAVAIA